MHSLFSFLQHWLVAYGVWAVCALLLLENAGVPLPGETSLLYAAFLAHRHGGFGLAELIPAATAACILGDNLGFLLARRFGAWVKRVLRLTPSRLRHAERFFQRYGDSTIFFARFVAGMRIIAGPAAGLLGMRWRTFFIFNALGAVAWVTTISTAGYLLASEWGRLAGILGRTDLVLLVVAAIAIALAIHRLQKSEQAPKARESEHDSQ
jgi:membrane protein DedA with SNARE-associated domain